MSQGAIRKLSSMFPRGEVWIVVWGRGLQILLGLAGLRALSSLLPQQELGYYYVITAIVSWFTLVLLNPVGMYAYRKANFWRKKDN